MSHRFAVTVHYEDTDMAGVVYHANFLRFIERARSDWVRGLGVDQRAMRAAGTVFVVRRVEADYLAPARFEDALEVTTEVAETRGARMVLTQDVRRGAERLFAARVTIVTIEAATGRVLRLPDALRGGPVSN